MHAVTIERFGGPEELRPAEIDEPQLGPDSVLIRVTAAGVNPVDTKIRQGAQAQRFPYLWPVVLGWDVSGTVEAVGPAVLDHAPGDAVIAYCRKDFVGQGAYAELVTMVDRHVTRRGSIDPVEAGGLPLAGLTAFQGLHDAIAIRPRETVIVRGASGGVGSFAVQIARAAGARVVAVAGADSEPFVDSLGVDAYVDYHRDDAVDAARSACDGGADALLDLAGESGLDDWVGAVRDGGRVASVLVPGIAERWQERRIRGQYVFVRPHGDQLSQLVELHGAGKLRIPLFETYELDDAADAHRRLEAGGVRGKITLVV